MKISRLCAAFAGVLAAFGASAVTFAAASWPTHECGHFLYWTPPQNGVAGWWWSVGVRNRRVGCATATAVVRELWYGKVVVHGGPSDALTWYTLPKFPGWRCEEGPESGLCTRRNASAGFTLKTVKNLPPADPCALQWPGGGSRKAGGGRLDYDRESSRRMVCQGWGTTYGGRLHVDWLTPGMRCALVATTVGLRYAETTGMFADGVCSATELVQHPGVVSSLGAACSTASDLLGLSLPEVGQLSGLACAGAPALGDGFAGWLEGHHEYAVAHDVIHRDRCLQFRQHLGTSSWNAVRCGR